MYDARASLARLPGCHMKNVRLWKAPNIGPIVAPVGNTPLLAALHVVVIVTV